MAFQALVSPSLTDLFVEQVQGMILSGELKVGEKLPTERELAATMKVSLAVVNGGISRLASRGFVRIAPRKGVYVEDYLRNGNISTLESILEYSENYFREDLLSAIMDFRRQFELKFTELACVCRTPVNLQNLEQLVEYPFWLALYQDRMTYPWKVEMWQYSDKGRVPGINGNVDLNVYMPD